MHDKDNKKPTEQDISKAYSAVQQNHDNICGITTGGTVADMAQYMAQQKITADTWSGCAVTAPDISFLQAEMESVQRAGGNGEEEDNAVGAEAGENEEGDEEDDTKSHKSSKTAKTSPKGITGGAGGGTPSKRPRAGNAASPPTKLPKWWDRDAEVASACRSVTNKAKAARDGLNEVVATFAGIQKDLEDNPAISNMVVNELAICKNRVDACSLVLGAHKKEPVKSDVATANAKATAAATKDSKAATKDSKAMEEQAIINPEVYEHDKEKLRGYIVRLCASHTSRRSSGPGAAATSASGGSSRAGRACLGEAPPCRSFQNLVCIEALFQQENVLLDCWTAEEVDENLQNSTNLRSAVTELIQMSKAAVTKLESVVNQGRKAMLEKAKDAAKKRNKKDHKKGGPPVLPLHDAGVAAAVPIAAHALANPLQLNAFINNFDPRIPAIISLPKVHTSVTKLVETFQVKFEQKKKDRQAAVKGASANTAVDAFRAQLPAKDDDPAADTFRGDIARCFPRRVAEAFLPAPLKASMECCVFGIEKSYSQPSNETNHLATLRLCAAGRRSVVVTSTSSLSTYFRARANAAATYNMTLKALQDKLHNMTVEEVSSYLKSKRTLYAATIGKGDILYLPAGATISEIVSSDADTLGLKTCLMHMEDYEVLKNLCEELILSGAKNPGIANHLTAIEATIKNHNAIEETKRAEAAATAAAAKTAAGVAKDEAADAAHNNEVGLAVDTALAAVAPAPAAEATEVSVKVAPDALTDQEKNGDSPNRTESQIEDEATEHERKGDEEIAAGEVVDPASTGDNGETVVGEQKDGNTSVDGEAVAGAGEDKNEQKDGKASVDSEAGVQAVAPASEAVAGEQKDVDASVDGGGAAGDDQKGNGDKPNVVVAEAPADAAAGRQGGAASEAIEHKDDKDIAVLAEDAAAGGQGGTACAEEIEHKDDKDIAVAANVQSPG